MTKTISKLFFVAFTAVALATACTPAPTTVESDFAFADKQLRVAIDETETLIANSTTDRLGYIFPRTITNDSLTLVSAPDWCSGFFPGELWYMYEYTQDPFWREQAEYFTAALESEKSNTTTHDLGFMMFCSYGNANRLTPDAHYEEVLLESARSLASRFNPTIGCIKSWDNWGDPFPWDFPVIIDNMMNLELLFWATEVSGDSTFYDIAVTHANTTIENHFRGDYTSCHVVDYDTITGEAISQTTHQGFSDESAWARGQAWGLYGYTVCYRATGDERYLAQAEKIAEAIFSQATMPEDLIPYWDYNSPEIPNTSRDVSAATVTASALYELSTMVENGSDYLAKANTIIESLSANYLNGVGTEHGFLLRSSTGHYTGGIEIDEPLVYADYYFLEALLRKSNLEKAQ